MKTLRKLEEPLAHLNTILWLFVLLVVIWRAG